MQLELSQHGLAAEAGHMLLPPGVDALKGLAAEAGTCYLPLVLGYLPLVYASPLQFLYVVQYVLL